MASFKIAWKRSAEKDLRSLPDETLKRVIPVVEKLAEDPIPPGSKRLIGTERTYRLRVGDYRIVYTVEQNGSLVEVVRVGHRKDIYR